MIIGVIGAGVMGSDIAQNLASFSHDVILMDNSENALANARKKSSAHLGLVHSTAKIAAAARPPLMRSSGFVSYPSMRRFPRRTI